MYRPAESGPGRVFPKGHRIPPTGKVVQIEQPVWSTGRNDWPPLTISA